MFVKLSGRPCLVVGAGTIAESKIASLLEAEANVKVIAPEAKGQVQAWARDRRILWEQRRFEKSDLEGCFLVVSASNDVQVDEAVFQAAKAQGVLCNVVDDPPRCDFYYPAVVRRGPLQIAISTSGESPALAQRLRRDLEHQFGPEYAAWVKQLGRDRQMLLQEGRGEVDQRRRSLHSQASASAYQQFLDEHAG